MKNNMTLPAGLFLITLITACRSSREFNAKGSNEEIVYKAIKFLNKNPNDPYALGELKFNYEQAVKNREEKIATWRSINDNNKWDKIITELNGLQNLYNSISSSANLLKTTKAQSYFNALAVAKDSAASYYYTRGLDYADKEGRDNAKEAYYAFKKADQYVNGYKDSRKKMKEVFESSIINVVINPLRTDNFSFSGWNNNGVGYNRDFVQQNLVRDLGGDYSTSIPAKFYTDWDARRKNVEVNWMVDLSWQNLYVPRPIERTYNRNASKRIEIGKDTSGKPVYKNVTATLHITRLSYSTNGDMEYLITDVKERKSITSGRLPASLDWQQEYATYSGDSRALDNDDWALVNNNRNNNRYNSPEDILNEMTRRVYNDLRYRIQSATDW